MSLRPINFVSGEYYHLYNRGNSKQGIFRDDADRHRFLKLLYTANSDKNLVVRDFSKNVYDMPRGDRLVSIGAYCLMSNHFHLLITPTERGDVSKFMHKLTTAYSMYYNNKYHRTGSLFEGKFKSEYVADDRYLKYLFSYIHLNPLKIVDAAWKNTNTDQARLFDFLKSYAFSSYFDYSKKDRSDRAIINPEDFPLYFPDQKAFESEIFDWITLA